MCGSTLETTTGAATKNIAEMLKTNIPKNIDVIIQTGGAASWRNYDIPNDKINRYKIENHKLVLLESLPQASMGESETLNEFIEWGTENHYGEEMGLILWNHGAGSVNGVCFDELYNMDSLTLNELNDALTNNHFEFIGFDACLMANYETAFVLAPFANHLIASEELEPTGGWDYSITLSHFGKSNYYNDILNSYKKKCEKADKTTYTLSHIDLTQFDKISYAFDYMCKEKLLKSTELKDIVVYAKETRHFGTKNQSQSCLIDLSMFAEKIGAEELVSNIDKYVESVCGTDREGAKGLSIYYPTSVEDLTEYLENPITNSYKTYLYKNYQNEDITGDKIKFVDEGSDKDGELYFEVTEDSLKYIQSIDYNIFQFVDGEREYEIKINALGIDSDVLKVGNTGSFTTSDKGIDIIKKYESYGKDINDLLNAYRNEAGVWTIGYGHTAGVEPGDTLASEEEAIQLLKEDLKNYERYVNNICRYGYITFVLNQNRFDALVSFAKNLGTVNLIKLVNGRTAEDVAERMMLYSRFGGKVKAELVQRRQEERALFLGE